MRAHTTNTTRRTRHILVLAVCALAVPVSANAEPTSSPPFATNDSGYSSINSIAPPEGSSSGSVGSADVDSGYSSVNAIAGSPADAPTVVSSSPSAADDGFDWPSALVGAGGALALASLGGAALLTMRRRSSVAPSTS